MNNFKTLSQLILFQSLKFNNPRALNFKQNDSWQTFSNQEFLQKSFYFACALKEFGLQKNQTFANISYQNPIWLIVDFGVILAGGVSVPMFRDVSIDNLFYQFQESDIDFVFVDDEEKLLVLQEKNLRKIISYNLKNSGDISFEEAILLGEKASQKYDINEFINSVTPNDLVTIIYTSGSTGKPKGVELTHNNLVSQIKATQLCFPLDKNSDKVLSFLPLAHIFERMVMMFYLTQGVEIYFVDDVKKLGDYLKETRPTLMTVVPRMLEKVFAKISQGVEDSGFIKKFLAKKSLNRALNKSLFKHQKPSLIDKIFDFLVYKKFRQALGGNMKMIICGGAALSQDLERFYKNIDINLYCGYGLTETSPVLAVNYKNNYKLGTVGKAFPFVELKIADDKELLARGENIMRGYHKQPQKTAESFVDGWFKTGDLAQIDNDGFVKIIGRKKELFKTATGKYVSPVPIEQKLLQELGFLIGAIIIAEGRKFVSALLFPDFEVLKKFKMKLNFNVDNISFF